MLDLHSGDIIVENMQKAHQFHSGSLFSFFSQGFDFSAGYFAFTKNRIRAF